MPVQVFTKLYDPDREVKTALNNIPRPIFPLLPIFHFEFLMFNF